MSKSFGKPVAKVTAKRVEQVEGGVKIVVSGPRLFVVDAVDAAPLSTAVTGVPGDMMMLLFFFLFLIQSFLFLFEDE